MTDQERQEQEMYWLEIICQITTLDRGKVDIIKMTDYFIKKYTVSARIELVLMDWDVDE